MGQETEQSHPQWERQEPPEQSSGQRPVLAQEAVPLPGILDTTVQKVNLGQGKTLGDVFTLKKKTGHLEYILERCPFHVVRMKAEKF